MHQRKAIYTLFIFIQSLIYGIGNPATKVAYKSITPLWLLAARFTLAFLLFLLLFGRRILPCIKKSQLEDLAAFLSLLRRSLYFLQPGT